MCLHKNIVLLSLFCFYFVEISAQVGIGTTNPDASSVLDIQSTNSGVLIPRIALLSSIDQVTISAPAISLLVYNTNTISDVYPGFYFWNGIQWSRINDRSNDNLNKVYGEIYNSSIEYSYTSMQNMDVTEPIRFEVVGEIQGVTPIPFTPPPPAPPPPSFQGFEIIRSGIYRVSYSVSVEMYKANIPPDPEPSAVRVGFYLTTSYVMNPIDNVDLLANRILGSFSRSRVTWLGHTSCSSSKIVHLNAGQIIRLFTDRNLPIVYVIRDTATMNIELIKAD